MLRPTVLLLTLITFASAAHYPHLISKASNSQTKAVYAECKLEHDSVSHRGLENYAEGFLRLKQTSLVKPTKVSGYTKYLGQKDESTYAIRVNELPTDQFNDCMSTGD